MDQNVYRQYVQILKEELIPALGCTEPIAIAYASAKAKEVLDEEPVHITVRCSGNIIKNVKGVIVPTTYNLKGVEASAIVGAVGGNPAKKLETLTDVRPEHIEKTRRLLAENFCSVELIEGESNLDIIIDMKGEHHTSLVEILYTHTNISRIERDGKVLLDHRKCPNHGSEADRSLLNLDDIFLFIKELDIDDVRDILDMQMKYNLAIAEEGLKTGYGAHVGPTLISHYPDSVELRARALAAAGSDARMNGCVLPVVINSGSGNQGMTITLPIMVYAEHLESSAEQRYRALAMANIIAIYLKSGLGKLSAYCGAVSAGASAGAGIAYLYGSSRKVIEDTLVNALANVSGIVCDGAKASCAAKIASSVEAALLGFFMAQKGHVFPVGEGLVQETTDMTIRAIGRMGRVGMKSTDVEILKIMIGQ